MGAPENEALEIPQPQTEQNTNGADLGDVRNGTGSDGSATAAPVSEDAPYGRNKDGTPAKKRGRKARTDGDTPQTDSSDTERLTRVRPPKAPRQAETPQASAPLGTAVPISIDYESLGKDAALLWIGVGQMLLGPDWVPEVANPQPGLYGTPFNKEGYGEYAAVRDSFSAFFKAKGIGQIDPTIALLVTLAGYTAKKAVKPTIAAKFKKGVQWVREQFAQSLRVFRKG